MSGQIVAFSARYLDVTTTIEVPEGSTVLSVHPDDDWYYSIYMLYPPLSTPGAPMTSVEFAVAYNGERAPDKATYVDIVHHKDCVTGIRSTAHIFVRDAKIEGRP